MKKKSGFFSTDESLALAKVISEKLQLPFDRENVRDLANNLERVYYEEIMEKLHLTLKDTDFYHGSIRKIVAQVHVDNSESTKYIYVDDQLDSWLLSICFLNAMATFVTEKKMVLSNLLKSVLDTFRMPYLFEDKRGMLIPYYKKHSELLGASHTLGKAMMVFIICHEIAHVTSGHFEKNLTRYAEEFEADALGYEYFKKVVQHPDMSGYIAIQEMYLFAPILLFHYFDMVERYVMNRTGSFPSRRGYPSPLARATALESTFNDIGSAHSHHILRLFLKGKNTLMEVLDFSEK